MPHVSQCFPRLRGRLGSQDVEVTEEMRATALARTNETLAKLDELRKRRELPVEMLPLIAEVFSSEMQTLHLAEVEKLDDAEDAKREVDLAKHLAEHGYNVSPAAQHGIPSLGEMMPPFAHHHAAHAHAGEWISPRAAAMGAPDAPKFDAQRVMMPVNSVAYLCKACNSKHAQGGVSVPYKIKPGERMQVTARPQRQAFRPEEITIENGAHWLVHDYSIGNMSQFAQRGDISGAAFAGLKLSGTTAQTAMDVTFDVTYRGPEKDGEQFLATVTGAAALY